MSEVKFVDSNKIIEMYKKGVRNFSNLKLVGTNLERLNLDGTIFRGSVLQAVRFAYCSLKGADFSDAVIELGGFAGANLSHANFQRAKISYEFFGDATFFKTDFRNAEIKWSYFADTNIGAADFAGAKIVKMFTSLSEVTEEDYHYILDFHLSTLKKLGVSEARILQIKSKIEEGGVLLTERVARLYDLGRSTNLSTLAYQPFLIGKTDKPTYVPREGVYTGHKEYGQNIRGESGKTYKQKKLES